MIFRAQNPRIKDFVPEICDIRHVEGVSPLVNKVENAAADGLQIGMGS